MDQRLNVTENIRNSLNSKPLSRQDTSDFEVDSQQRQKTQSIITNTANTTNRTVIYPSQIINLKRPPRNPWQNKDIQVEVTKIARRPSISKVNVNISAITTRTTSMEQKRYAKTPDKRPNLRIDIPKYATDEKQVAVALLVQNKEIKMKHELAQSIIELINLNEKSLVEADSKLNGFLNKSMAGTSGNPLVLIESLKKQWVCRLQNLSKIFDLIDRKSVV